MLAQSAMIVVFAPAQSIRPGSRKADGWRNPKVRLNYGGRLYQTSWPTYEEAKTVESEVEIAVQVNGKVRATIKIAADISKEDAIAAGKAAVADKLTGQIVKEIYVPGRLVNIVQKGWPRLPAEADRHCWKIADVRCTDRLC